MKLIFLNIASASEEWSELAEQRYLKKLSHFYQVELKSLKPSKQSREASADKKIAEAKQILATLDPSDFVVLLDERGATLSSREFAKKFEQWTTAGKKRLVFIIGGAFGVADEVKSRADFKLSLSSFVFNHLLAQVVILEQVYRAISINKNLPYHND